MTFDTLDTEQFTQELQFLGSFGERFDYLVGLYYFKEEGDHFQHIDIDIPLPFIPEFGFGPIAIDKDRDIDAESESKAVFAQVTWTPAILDDRLELTFGGRYTEDNRKATRTTLNFFQQGALLRHPPVSSQAPFCSRWQQHRRGLQQVQSGVHREHGVDDGCKHLSAHRHRLQGRRHFRGRRGRNLQFRLRLRA